MRTRKALRLAPVPFRITLAAILVLQLLAVACTSHRKPSNPGAVGMPFERGIASWYGSQFHGRRTASGERYDMNELTAAHPSLPFGTRIGVRNSRSGREVVVRINDRGPFSKNRIIDLSYAAAREVGLVGPGTASVELYLAPAAGAPPRYTVQVGAFSDAGRAVVLHQEVVRIYPEALVDFDGTWNRVQIGAFHNRDQAEALRRELAVIGLPSVVVAAR